MSNYRVRQAMRAGWGLPKDEHLLLSALGTYLRDDDLTASRATDADLMRDCGFPRTSLRRARKALIKAGLIDYTPGFGKGHSGIYVFRCLPEGGTKGSVQADPITGDAKGSVQADPIRAAMGSERPSNGVRPKPTTSGNGNALIPTPELLQAPPGPVVVPAPGSRKAPPLNGSGAPRSREEIIDRWVAGEISTEEKQAAIRALRRES